MPYVKPSTSVEDRLNAWIEKCGDCWIWTGETVKGGYGRITVRGVRWLAHRLAYVTWHGPIPDGYEVDHLCRTPPCVNPDHLEAVTGIENIRRSTAPSAHALRTNECVNGHEYTPENTYRQTDGRRYCRQCVLDRRRRDRQGSS